MIFITDITRILAIPPLRALCKNMLAVLTTEWLLAYKLEEQSRPVARIFRRGVTWMSGLYKHARLGGVWGHAPPGEIRCSQIASA